MRQPLVAEMPSKQDVRNFCAGCDHLKTDGSCAALAGTATTKWSHVFGLQLQLMLARNSDVPVSQLEKVAADLALNQQGATAQERRVAYGECEEASVGGQRVIKTHEGFSGEAFIERLKRNS